MVLNEAFGKEYGESQYSVTITGRNVDGCNWLLHDASCWSDWSTYMS